jgi:hypothetical protein
MSAAEGAGGPPQDPGDAWYLKKRLQLWATAALQARKCPASEQLALQVRGHGRHGTTVLPRANNDAFRYAARPRRAALPGLRRGQTGSPPGGAARIGRRRAQGAARLG